MSYDPYITAAYYAETYKGAAIDSGSFDRIALRASEEIDRITFNRVRRAGISGFDTEIQDAVMRATCAMAEALARIDAATDGTGIVTTHEKVGGYDYTVDAASINALKVEAIRSARSILMPTGLLYAGI